MSVPASAQTAGSDDVAGDPSRWRQGWFGDAWVAASCLAGGVALGALWVLVGTVVLDATDVAEQHAASDGTLALLGTFFGLVSAVLLAVLPGSRPVLRTGVALAGSTLGSFVGLATGLILGMSPLRATGVVLAWPVMLGGVTTLRLLVLHLIGKE